MAAVAAGSGGAERSLFGPPRRHGAQQALLVPEKVIKRRQRATRTPDNVGETGAVITLFEEQSLRRIQNRIVPPFAR